MALEVNDNGLRETGLRSFDFKSGGSRLYFIGTENESIYEFTLDTNWDVGSGSTQTNFLNTYSQSTRPHGLFFRPSVEDFI